MLCSALQVELVALRICLSLSARDIAALRRTQKAVRAAVDAAVAGLSLAWKGPEAMPVRTLG